MGKFIFSNQKGQAVILTSAVCLLLLVMLALVVDMGNLYLQKTKLQTAVDAAALAGAQSLPGSTANARDAANQYMLNNGIATTATITFAESNSKIIVTVSQNVPTYFLRVIGTKTVAVGATATALNLGGSGSGGASPFDYALYSAGPQTLEINQPAQGQYHGSFYSGGNIKFPGGGIRVNGDVVAKGSVTGYNINGNSVHGSVIEGSTQNLALPDYKSAISQMASVSGSVYTGSQSLSGKISGDTYVKNGDLRVGDNPTSIKGSTFIMADGNITVNAGNVKLTGGGQLFIYSTNGDVTINGGGTYNWSSSAVVLYAPHGTAYAGGGGEQLAYASIVAQQILPNGGSIYFHKTNKIDLPVATGTPHARLVR